MPPCPTEPSAPAGPAAEQTLPAHAALCVEPARDVLRTRPEQALRLALHGLALLREAAAPTDGLMAELHLIEGHAHYLMGHQREAHAALSTAIDLARVHDRPALLEHGLRLTGAAWYRLGDYDQALTHFAEALDAAVASGDAAAQCKGWANVALVKMRAGELDSAVQTMQRCLASPELDPSGRARMLGNLAHAELERGRPQDAVATLQQMLALVERHGLQGLQAAAHTALGQALARAGRPQAALPVLQTGLQLARQHGDRRQQGQAHLGLGLAHQAMGDLLVAQQHFETARQVARALEAPAEEVAACEPLVAILRAHGELEAALRCLDDLRALERRLQQRRDSLKVHALLARLALQQSRHEAALTALRNGELQQQNEALQAANAALNDAMRQLGYTGTAEQAQAVMSQAGLTAREHQVLQRLTMGRRNAQIADELGLSAVTVRHHVSSVLAKLGARSRTQAAAMALQAGLA